jgi:DNA-binding response OmpR family regulator
MAKVAWLTGKQADGQSVHCLLEKEVYLIGRRVPADLVLPYRRISRQHAQIRRDELGYYLTDLGSRNETFVNGRSIGREPHRLYSGDEIVFGGVVTFRFHDPDETREGPRLGRLQGIWIDPQTHAVWVDGEPVEPHLSTAQFTLLEVLYNSVGKIVSRAQIILRVWPDVDPSGVSGEAVDGLIKRLRKRLRQAQPKRDYIKVVRGHGLRLLEPEEVNH